jgi:hypothetical protein
MLHIFKNSSTDEYRKLWLPPIIPKIRLRKLHLSPHYPQNRRKVQCGLFSSDPHALITDLDAPNNPENAKPDRRGWFNPNEDSNFRLDGYAWGGSLGYGAVSRDVPSFLPLTILYLILLLRP